MLQMQNAMLHFLCILTRPRISIQGVPLVPTTQSGHKNDKGGRFARRPRTECSPFSFTSLRLVQPLAIAFRDSVTNLINLSRLCSGNFAQFVRKTAIMFVGYGVSSPSQGKSHNFANFFPSGAAFTVELMSCLLTVWIERTDEDVVSSRERYR